MVNWYYSSQEQLASVESRVLEDQMVEKLLERANIIEKPCSYQEALHRPSETAEGTLPHLIDLNQGRYACHLSLMGTTGNNDQ